MNLYNRILVAIDLSDESTDVLNKAQAMAQTNNATLDVLHVIEPLTLAYGTNISFNMAALETELTGNVKKRFHEIVNAFSIEENRQHIVQGVPEKEVHAMAKELDADLIITGNHGRHGLSLILGSTSTAILHGAPCDVFTVRVGSHH